MRTHVKVLGVLYIALSALGVCAALFLILAFGIAAGSVGMSADAHDAAITLPILGLAGSALVAFLLALSLPGIITGIGLLKFSPWARILGIVLGILHLLYFPFGTALGIYALWVLFNKETERLFSGAPVPLM
jgi:hypothetical protein